MSSLVVMGVTGCGKSSLGVALADATGLPLIEGDDFHPAANVAKMKAGIPLQDEDRAGWLDELGRQLAQREAANGSGAVLTCSALKLAYRARLRAAAPGLRFVHMALTRDESLRRVSARASHFMSPKLVDSQFAALESPEGEAGVLTLDATLPLPALTARTLEWLGGKP